MICIELYWLNCILWTTIILSYIAFIMNYESIYTFTFTVYVYSMYIVS